MKSSASESKPFQNRSKGKIPGRVRGKERSHSKLKLSFLIDSDAELFMNLIQCISFGSWKVRRLNQALVLTKSNENERWLRFRFINGVFQNMREKSLGFNNFISRTSLVLANYLKFRKERQEGKSSAYTFLNLSQEIWLNNHIWKILYN